MRGLLLGLLVANIIYAGMTLAVKANVVDRGHLHVGAGGGVQLVSEVAPSQLHEYPPNPVVVDVGNLPARNSGSVVPPPSSYCVQVGVFESITDASDFISVYGASMAVALDARLLEVKPQYRVYLPPLESRGAAISAIEQLRATLSANKLVIDSFLIPQGDLVNGIALGLFSEPANAENVKLQLEKVGYEVVIQEVQAAREELNVMIRELKSEAVFQGYWAEIQRVRPYLRAVEKLCETIAQGI